MTLNTILTSFNVFVCLLFQFKKKNTKTKTEEEKQIRIIEMILRPFRSRGPETYKLSGRKVTILFRVRYSLKYIFDAVFCWAKSASSRRIRDCFRSGWSCCWCCCLRSCYCCCDLNLCDGDRKRENGVGYYPQRDSLSEISGYLGKAKPDRAVRGDEAAAARAMTSEPASGMAKMLQKKTEMDKMTTSPEIIESGE